MINIIISIVVATVSVLLTAIVSRKLNRGKLKLMTAQTENTAVQTLESALKTINEDVLSPIITENKEIKVEIKKLTNEITKLQKAIKSIATCKYSDNCPVQLELQSKAIGDASSDKN